MGKFSEAAQRYAASDTQDISEVAPPVQEKGLFAKAAAQAMEVLPTAQEIGEQMNKEASVAMGFIGKVAADVGAELGRLGVQGQAEVSQALYTGNGSVAYGEGQQEAKPENEQQRERERGGMER